MTRKKCVSGVDRATPAPARPDMSHRKTILWPVRRKRAGLGRLGKVRVATVEAKESTAAHARTGGELEARGEVVQESIDGYLRGQLAGTT